MMHMRYAYIKYGNVLDELRTFGPAPSVIPPGGPETFTGTFLQEAGNSASLLVSWLPKRQQTKRLTLGSSEARVYFCPNGFVQVSLAVRLFVALCRFRPSIVICARDGWALWAAYMACRFMRVPFIHSRQRAMRVEGDSWRRRVIATIDGFAIRRAARVMCHGPFTHQQLLEIGVLESEIIEFDIQLDDIFTEMRRVAVERTGEQRSTRQKIFYLGRVELSKGVLDLLEACLPILRARKNTDLVYVGVGGALPLLQQRVKMETVASQVEFAGRIPHSQVGVRLRDATVLVTPTRHGLEGWGMAALEGLAVGIPVVAPAAGPFPFMIEDGTNGLLYAVDSVEDLRRKLLRILEDPDLRRNLSRGAIEFSKRRAQLCKSFGQALREAIAQARDQP
jgi:glycosyltransferase involved in cell wall biosynthesis